MTVCNHKNAIWGIVILTATLSSGLFRPAVADNPKLKKSPCFWQRDPRTNYPNEGRYHCAPVAVAEGLVYLATIRGHNGLVQSVGEWGQIALINDLARAMETNPNTGTTLNSIANGVFRYAEKRDYSVDHLEIVTGIRLSKRNRQYVVGAKPNLRWMRAAVADPDAVVTCIFGWYRKDKNGLYTREGGHWVNLVGAGPQPLQFDIHNPSLEVMKQKKNTAITLAPLHPNFIEKQSETRTRAMRGFYQAQGPGLPYDAKRLTAVLESAIAFRLRKN